ncbi:hypothetical protein BHE74_00047133, partial [Ensete ventricosum]
FSAHNNVCPNEVTPTAVQLVCVNPNSNSPPTHGLGKERMPKVASTVRQAPAEDEVAPPTAPQTLER